MAASCSATHAGHAASISPTARPLNSAGQRSSRSDAKIGTACVYGMNVTAPSAADSASGRRRAAKKPAKAAGTMEPRRRAVEHEEHADDLMISVTFVSVAQRPPWFIRDPFRDQNVILNPNCIVRNCPLTGRLYCEFA